MEAEIQAVKVSSFARPTTLRGNQQRSVVEELIRYTLLGCGLISILTTFGIVISLLYETFEFFREVPITAFLFGTDWAPLFSPPRYGVLPLVNGTLLVAFGAMVVALPVGLLSAIFLSEYASPRTRGILKPMLEILAGVPTVVYGYFALTFVTPFIRSLLPDPNSLSIFNALSAGLVMGIMIIPLVSSLSEDALASVPRALREAAYGMGATKWEVSTQVVVPAALSGVVASFILAISRAVGETMIAAVAAGATAKLTLNPMESVETMAAYIARVSLGDTPQGSIEFFTIFAVGFLLFLITFLLNLFSQWFVRRFREVYQ